MEKPGYKEFQQDVVNTFNDLIEDYSLKVNENIIEEFETDCKCILENSFCRLDFNLLKYFPHMTLTVDLFLKDQYDNIHLIQDYKQLLSIDDNIIDSYYSEYIKVKKPYDDLRGSILNDLQWMHMLFSNLYLPMIDGKIDYIHYEKWKKSI